MKQLLYGALIGLILILAVISVRAKTNGAPILTYVYSNSMEPLIKVNDAFLVCPVKKLAVGDIIMYRPMVLKAPYITHRIIAIGESGYITKGDNSAYKDQDNGEPEVIKEQIIGKVVTINGQPLIVPGLGNISAHVQEKLGNNSRYLSGVFLLFAILTFFVGKKNKKKRKNRNRWRLRHVYQILVILSACTIIVSIYHGSRVSKLQYLVSEYPSNQGDQIELNKPDQLVLKIKNNSFFPVWTIVSGIDPLSVHEAPEYLWLRSEGTVLFDVAPQNKIGLYQGYVQVYNYPILLPRAGIQLLHQASPFFAVLATGLAMALWIHILLLILNHIHGFEDWIPLRAIRDKVLQRRIKRAKAKLLGRRKLK
ncbi:MAG: signal peptidase I [Mobilitalea sp.]